MSTTIFCTFNSQDEADFALGRIRSENSGVKNISEVTGYGRSPGMFSMSVRNAETPRRVTLRIVCAESARKAVLSRLVNLRATGIITTP